jgi:hypothetical protein
MVGNSVPIESSSCLLKLYQLSAGPYQSIGGPTSKPRALPNAYWFSPVALLIADLVYMCGLR